MTSDNANALFLLGKVFSCVGCVTCNILSFSHLRLIRQHYLAAVTYVDGLIGNILAEVEGDRTVVAVIGDHGWSLGERAEFSKMGNFEEKTRVPFIVFDPGNPTGKVVEDNVELLDLFPTLADLAGLPPVPACPPSSAGVMLCTQGRSLSHYISSNSSSAGLSYSFAFSQYPRPSRYPSFNSDEPHLRDIR